MTDKIQALVNLAWNSLPERKTGVSEIEKVVVKEVVEMLPQQGRLFVRLAGLSGAAAVILGAYGAHAFRNNPDVDEHLKLTFETGNRYHFMHTLALLAVPLTRKPLLVGGLLTSGIVLFSGSCYYHALTEDPRVRKVTPFGGFCLIFGWLAMIL